MEKDKEGGALPAAQDRAGAPDGAEPAAQSQAKPLIPSASIAAARAELERLSELLYPEPFGASRVSIYAADLYALVHAAENAA